MELPTQVKFALKVLFSVHLVNLTNFHLGIHLSFLSDGRKHQDQIWLDLCRIGHKTLTQRLESRTSSKCRNLILKGDYLRVVILVPRQTLLLSLQTHLLLPQISIPCFSVLKVWEILGFQFSFLLS